MRTHARRGGGKGRSGSGGSSKRGLIALLSATGLLMWWVVVISRGVRSGFGTAGSKDSLTFGLPFGGSQMEAPSYALDKDPIPLKAVTFTTKPSGISRKRGSAAVPVAVQVDGGSGTTPFSVRLTMCEVDWAMFYERPWDFPVFGDVAAASRDCSEASRGGGRKVTVQQALDERGPSIKDAAPSGFVFHMGPSVGAALAVNALASVAHYRVYAHSEVLSQVLVALAESDDSSSSALARQEKVDILRSVVRLLCDPEGSVRYTFDVDVAGKPQQQQVGKAEQEEGGGQVWEEEDGDGGGTALQTFLVLPMWSTSRAIGMLREAFPDTPWAYLYDDPASVSAAMMRWSAPLQSPRGAEAAAARVERGRGSSSDSDKGDEKAQALSSLLPDCLLWAGALPASLLEELVGGGGERQEEEVEEEERMTWASLKPPRRSQRKHAQRCSDLTQRPSTTTSLRVNSVGGGRGVLLHRTDLPEGIPRLVSRHFKAPLSSAEEYRMFLTTKLDEQAGAWGGVTKAERRAAAAAAAAAVPGSDARDRRSVPPPGAGASAAERYAGEGAAKLEGVREEVNQGLGGLFSVQWGGDKPSTPGHEKGMHTLVDPAAPLFMSSEVYSDNMFPFECPDVPAAGYPQEYPVMDLLNNWSMDDASFIPAKHYNGICRFDFQKQQSVAEAYRRAEVPFIVYNVPELEETSRKWADPNFVSQGVGKDTKYEAEVSESNHFLYFTGKGGLRDKPPDWKPPTVKQSMSYEEWLRLAVLDDGGTGQPVMGGEGSNLPRVDENGEEDGAPDIHYYFRISDSTKSPKPFISQSLPMLANRKDASFFLTDPRKFKGIHCRFGMHGVLAEAHYDGTRNMVALVTGKRRWILARPEACASMYMFPPSHPSARHTAVNWGKPDLDAFPNFPKTMANEIILRAGEVLYVPGGWIHTITNLGVNAQCNARSGRSQKHTLAMRDCTNLAERDKGFFNTS